MEQSEMPWTKDWLRNYERPFLTMSCGDWTYGRPFVHLADSDTPRALCIGRYCSIGEDVHINVGRQGRHPLDTLSSSPFGLFVDPNKRFRVQHHAPWMNENLDVVIGDDVWIASGVTIMAGVSIGTGAVVGARAVVTKSIPAYGVAVGVPARTISFRHNETIRQKLLLARWWELQPDELWDALGDDVLSTDLELVITKLQAHKDRRGRNGTNDSLLNPKLHLKQNGPLRDKSLDEMLDIFMRTDQSPYPKWPDEETQRQYTGGAGIFLLERARSFISALAEDFAFVHDWKGLDYGCGWGRVSSYLLAYGAADQLDMCDAWQVSLELVERAGFKNHVFRVSDELTREDLPNNKYDFCLAMSVFTHLTKKSFINNFRRLIASLHPGGKLYLTVRHRTFLEGLIESGKVNLNATLDDDGFWTMPYPGLTTYGETVVEKRFLEKISFGLGELVYLGSTEYEQHLYRVTKSTLAHPVD